MAKILLVDDEESIRVTVGEFIEEAGHEVHTAEDVAKAFELMEEHNFDVIVTDIIMPKITGIELLRRIHETSPDIPIIMMTGEPEVNTASAAVRAGAFDYLSKPISSDAIKKVIRNAVKTKTLNDEKKRLEEENRRYREDLEELVKERTGELRESEEKFRTLFQESIDGIYLTNVGGKIVDCNKALLDLFGYTREEMMAINIGNTYVNPRDRDRFKKAISGDGFVRNFEVKFHRKDATEMDCNISSITRRGGNSNIIGYQGIIRDITERKNVEKHIINSLREKELLIQELYHRTKNNMQVICAMLELQSEESDDEQLVKAFREMKDRIMSMALVHEKLYKSQDLSRIDLDDYVSDLTKILMHSNNVSSDKIAIKVDITSFPISIDIAIPVGLILNELISNSLKHAFPNDSDGEISLIIKESDSGMIELQYSDNGIGLSEDIKITEMESFGIQSLILLVEYQLKGTIDFSNKDGFTCQIRFKDDFSVKRV